MIFSFPVWMPDLLLLASGVIVKFLFVLKHRQKQCPVCLQYWGDSVPDAVDWERCPECGVSLKEHSPGRKQKKTENTCADISHSVSVPLQTTPDPETFSRMPNISPASYLQYRTAYRESRMLLSWYLLFCCLLPLLMTGISYAVSGDPVQGILFHYGIPLVLMTAGILCRPFLEYRLALYYGLITRCVHCDRNLYRIGRYSFFAKTSVCRILFSGCCPHCRKQIVKSAGRNRNPEK